MECVEHLIPSLQPSKATCAAAPELLSLSTSNCTVSFAIYKNRHQARISGDADPAPTRTLR
eukprot:2308978-Amphidinium_carterae.1